MILILASLVDPVEAWVENLSSWASNLLWRVSMTKLEYGKLLYKLGILLPNDINSLSESLVVLLQL